MSDIVTLAQLRSIFPKINSALLAPINETMVKYTITAQRRKASFLAQCGHESAYFTRFEENLNYSAAGLTTTFGKYFNAVTAAQAARQPQKIANIVYANRMGNGNTASNDGWTFRGRGAIQLTGKDTYLAFGKDMKIVSLSDVVAFISTPRGAIMSAGWFWSTRGLNALADADQITAQTKKINGGTNGLEERVKLYKKGLTIFK
jgi:putative chitinase